MEGLEARLGKRRRERERDMERGKVRKWFVLMDDG